MSQNSVPGGAAISQKDEQQQNPSSSQSNSSVTLLDIQSIRLVSDTLKRNPKIELSQSDLLKLLCYLEGELQARDVVIAALRSENLKRFITSSNTSTGKSSAALKLNDPHAALFRDHVALSGNIASKESSTSAARCEMEIRNVADQRMQALEELIVQQRKTQCKMVSILKNVESKQKQLVQELDEERRKHESDTAQGDDITYGLELERTRLKQELEIERESKKSLEKDLKKLQESLEAEQARQKQIVLFLLVERKKIIMKYIEEKKRSEDLALILSEEKVKQDTMADDLEEESKKSLRMEAEMEKQAVTFDHEKEALLARIAREEAKTQERDLEIKQLRDELDELRKVNGRPKFIATSQVKPTTGIAKPIIGPTGTVRSSATPISIATKTQPPQPPLKKSAIVSTAAANATVNAANISVVSRGNPPPIPPNKPVIPVKRDQNSRIPYATTGTAISAARSGSCDFEDASQTYISSNITK